MLSLSRKTDYALVALAYLGGPAAGAGAVSARQVAQGTRLPEPVTQTVLKALSLAKIISSTRGSAGGYELCKEPAEVSVLDVAHAIDGPIQLVACCEDDPNTPGKDCRLAGDCPISPAIHRLHDRLMAVLMKTTLADLLPREGETLGRPTPLLTLTKQLT